MAKKTTAKNPATKETKQATARPKLKVGIIGVGGMGTGHCNTIKTLVPEMKLAAVCDIDEPTVSARSKTFRVPGFTSHKALIKAKLVDMVIIATPHPCHGQIAVDCMKAGLHVISEKPLTERISTAEKMVKASKKYKVKFGVMFQRRFEADVEKAFEIAKSGKLGTIHRTVMISPEYRSQAYYDSGTWRATWNGEGGGVMMNQAPHVIDIFVNLTGMPESVRGRLDTRMHHVEIEDLAEATFRYKGGGTGYFYCSTNEPGPGQMIEVYGDKGKLIWRDGGLEFWTYTPSVSRFTKINKEMWGSPKREKVELKIRDKKNGHFRVMRNFARHILYKEVLRCSGESGLASLELTNAIMLSGWLNEEIKLPVNRAAYDRELKRLRETSTFEKGNTSTKRVTDPNHAS